MMAGSAADEQLAEASGKQAAEGETVDALGC